MKGTKKKNIIEILKDDNEYYNGIGRQYLSNSDIGTLLKNPRDFGKKLEDSKEFAMGRYFHQLFLEPSKAEEWDFIDVSSRATKKYKEYVEELKSNSTRERNFALLQKEKEEVHKWVEAMKLNDDFLEHITDSKNKYEVPMIKEIQGELWKGKADIVGNDFIFDLKTTSSIFDFKWNARKYNYDSQAYIYQELFGKPMVFLVIDKSSLVMGFFSVSDESLERGKQKVARAIEIYRKFYGDNPTEDINQYYLYEEI